ncbi:MAG: hypothetical protein ACNFW9_00860 [Candidatus Kerfeldbacteria bacterium]
MPNPINKPDLSSPDTKRGATSEIEDIFEHEDANKVEQQPEPVEVKVTLPEVSKEITPEKKVEKEQQKENEINQMQQAPPPVQPDPVVDKTTVSEERSVDLMKIENILSDHLDELFLQMTPQEQMAFKKKGEETAEKVNELLKETKIKVKEILVLIKEWLKIIPGVNKFFIEQEAKIKTDRLLNLRERE